ncbi:uncharacterized protein LOC141849102 [Brevipalpus obovatus]|uniref:uncharacterized protein LOC141849102 n=1 Tax=Brevipalpus obovatus TaxID=246614 RepID=UPI003D9E2549
MAFSRDRERARSKKAAMEFVTSNPFLVRKILDFVPFCDVYKCRLVSRIWFQEASRQLNKCPPLNNFTVVIEAKDSRSDLMCLKIDRQYFKPQSRFAKTLSTKIPLQGFFGGHMKCYPSLTFIYSDFYISDIINEIPINNSTVMVSRNSFKLHPGSLDLNFQFGNIDLENKCGKNIFMDAIHFNRFASNHKVIITDWSDPESLKPDLKDEEFPVKSVIFLCSNKGLDAHFEEFDAFIQQSNPDCAVSGGSLCPPEANISFISNDDGQWKESHALSIAFAGKDVQSAVFGNIERNDDEDEDMSSDEDEIMISDSEDDEDYILDCKRLLGSMLRSFKKKLDFRIDDGRVFAFLYIDFGDDAEGRGIQPKRMEGLRVIREEFPRVNFIRLRTLDRIGREDFNLHLIRV